VGLRGGTVAGGDSHAGAPATLENYADAKRLPVEFLASLGLVTAHIQGRPAVKMPTFDGDGAEIGARLRGTLSGKNRFNRRKGARVQPYGCGG